jgi:hypothetical protein
LQRSNPQGDGFIGTTVAIGSLLGVKIAMREFIVGSGALLAPMFRSNAF